ncbi:MAG: hypothetical protein HQL38_03100 [Alphaproteobacteria bacterium]|nr:hypothetical protein [Alphaproteobacteria bacterium]
MTSEHSKIIVTISYEDDENGFCIDDNGPESDGAEYEERAVDAEAEAEGRARHYRELGFQVEICKPGWM